MSARHAHRRLRGHALFLRDAFGAPCALAQPGPLPWTASAEALLRAHVAELPERARPGAWRRLRRRAEAAARSQQYATVSATTLRARFARRIRPSPEGETRR